jgi:hypothetical protein
MTIICIIFKINIHHNTDETSSTIVKNAKVHKQRVNAAFSRLFQQLTTTDSNGGTTTGGSNILVCLFVVFWMF